MIYVSHVKLFIISMQIKIFLVAFLASQSDRCWNFEWLLILGCNLVFLAALTGNLCHSLLLQPPAPITSLNCGTMVLWNRCHTNTERLRCDSSRGDAVWRATAEMSAQWFSANETPPVTRGKETFVVENTKTHWCAAFESWQGNAQRDQVILHLIHMHVSLKCSTLFICTVPGLWAQLRWRGIESVTVHQRHENLKLLRFPLTRRLFHSLLTQLMQELPGPTRLLTSAVSRCLGRTWSQLCCITGKRKTALLQFVLKRSFWFCPQQ